MMVVPPLAKQRFHCGRGRANELMKKRRIDRNEFHPPLSSCSSSCCRSIMDRSPVVHRRRSSLSPPRLVLFFVSAICPVVRPSGPDDHFHDPFVPAVLCATSPRRPPPPMSGAVAVNAHQGKPRPRIIGSATIDVQTQLGQVLSVTDLRDNVRCSWFRCWRLGGRRI
jgi:hypothetical protein